MIKITVNLFGDRTIMFYQKEFYNLYVKEEMENPKFDFVRIGDNIFRKSEIKYILVEREETK